VPAFERVYRFTPLLQRCPEAHPGPVPTGTGRLRGAEVATGPTLPRPGPSVACLSLPV